VFCSVPPKAYSTGAYQCPVWEAAWAASPPALGSLYSTTPTSTQADGATMSFHDPDGEFVQQSNPDEACTV
jgi:hypothetical protein